LRCTTNHTAVMLQSCCNHAATSQQSCCNHAASVQQSCCNHSAYRAVSCASQTTNQGSTTLWGHATIKSCSSSRGGVPLGAPATLQHVEPLSGCTPPSLSPRAPGGSCQLPLLDCCCNPQRESLASRWLHPQPPFRPQQPEGSYQAARRAAARRQCPPAPGSRRKLHGS
jgi:hypothetical protein